MFKKKYIGVALAGALALGAFSGSAMAAPTNVNGVVIDPSSDINLTIDAINFRESSVSAVGDTVTGYGKLASINGSDQGEFCPGCDVGFEFSYTVKSIDNSGPNPNIVFDMGSINFYVDDTEGFMATDPSSAHNGSLWLTLSGHAAPRSGYADTGELYSTVYDGSVSTPGDSHGYGLLDSTGGPSMAYFNTNSGPDGADFAFNSSFLFKPANSCSAVTSDPGDICHYPISGTGELIGSTSVPEPGVIGMMGLGLGFLALAMRRRRKETDERA